MTNPGCVREKNEDSIALPGLVIVGTSDDPISVVQAHSPSLAAVIDGLGGHRNGALASRTVAHLLLDLVETFTGPGDIEAGLDSINNSLFRSMEGNDSLSGYGAVAAGVVVSGDEVFVFNLGDARVYEYTENYAVLASVDQRVPGTNMVTQALGGSQSYRPVSPNIWSRALQRQMRFLICSDGLWGSVEFSTIEESLSIKDSRAAVAALMHAALTSDADDNVSLVVLDIDPSIDTASKSSMRTGPLSWPLAMTPESRQGSTAAV
jgi:serine/threonine protein phosphatase PrpC